MPQRRRGAELKDAIYSAAVELLEQEGYEAVTFQNVAKRAKTTRSVLYRYWEDTFTLIYEASRQAVMKSPNWHGSVIDQSFNSGSLRTDLLEMLKSLRDNSQLFPKNFLSFMYFEQAQGKKHMDERILDIESNNLIIIERILARAQERGEARENIAKNAKLLPFQISRYHIFIDNKLMTDDDISHLVDEILLPIYKEIVV